MKFNSHIFGIIWLSILVTFVRIDAQQEIAFENISIPEGLSSNIVFTVYEDRFGILWIGTSEGINRYDGYTITSYKNDPDNPYSLNGNQIFEIIEDKEGYIWTGGNSGVSRFDRNTERFENFLLDSNTTNPQSHQAFSLVEDNKGNIWIGSIGNTIKRFDKEKNRIIEFEPKLESGEELTVPGAGCIAEGNDGRIYFAFFNYGFARYQYEGDYFELLECDQPDYKSYFEGNFSLGLEFDGNNNLWTTAGEGLIVYNFENKSVKLVDLPDYTHGFGTLSAYKISIINGNDLWLGTNNFGLYRYRIDEDIVSHFTQDGLNENSLKSNSIFHVISDSFGDIWVSTLGGGLAKYNVDKEPFTLIKIDDESQSGQNFTQITSLYEISDSEVLIGTVAGLYTAGDKSGDVKKLNVSDTRISSIFPREESVLWLGSADGVIAFDKMRNRVVKSADVDLINKKLKTPFTRQILKDNSGNIWVVSTSALVRMDMQDNSIQTFEIKNRRTYSEKVLSGIRSISGNKQPLQQILEVGEDQQIQKKFSISEKAKYIVIAAGEGINVPELFDFGWITNSSGDTVWTIENFITTFHFGGALKNRVRFDTVELEQGDYFLNYKSDVGHSYGAWNEEAPPDSNLWGIQIIDIDQDYYSLVEMIVEENAAPFIDATAITRIMQSKSGDFWAATNEGIVKFDGESFEPKKYSSQSLGDRGFINDITRDIVEDSDGMLWIATQGGLIRFNPVEETAISLTTEDGLPSSQIVSLLEDDYGYLWMGSLNGLTKFDKSSIHEQPYFVNYDIKDGLQGYFFTTGAVHKSENGRLYFGGLNGLNSFYPGRINEIPPKLVINEFYVSNNYVTTVSENSPLEKNILETTELTLQYSQNDISFNFAAIHYLRPERNKLAYMMEGLDTGWVYDNRRYAAFTNLDPGDYTFKVKGANSDGIWNEETRAISITVLPPWYRTTLAYIFYGLAFITALFTFDRVQRNRILAKEREKQRIQEAELRALAAEAEAKVIQAENERKTKELEEARELQLSMLPVELPKLPHLDIAVYMKTATEVGGDYYDFHIGMDGTLTCVIGDATGHGLNAGTMVTATKSLFSTHASNNDILFTFDEISRCLKSMRMRLLSMCLQIAKIRGNELTISSAGMPPALLYRNADKNVEELLMKGMPLGAPASIPYEVKKTTLNSGDTLLMLSDGFPELFNSRKEMYGYERVMDTFKKFAHQSAEEIIDSLKDEGSNYVEDRDPDDDVTFVVIKVK